MTSAQTLHTFPLNIANSLSFLATVFLWIMTWLSVCSVYYWLSDHLVRFIGIKRGAGIVSVVLGFLAIRATLPYLYGWAITFMTTSLVGLWVFFLLAMVLSQRALWWMRPLWHKGPTMTHSILGHLLWWLGRTVPRWLIYSMPAEVRAARRPGRHTPSPDRQPWQITGRRFVVVQTTSRPAPLDGVVDQETWFSFDDLGEPLSMAHGGDTGSPPN